MLVLVYFKVSRTGGVMVSVLASDAVDLGFESRSSHTKDYTIGICCFSDMHTALRRKSKICWSSTEWTSSSSH